MAVAGLLRFEVPLTGVAAAFGAPTKTDRAMGEHGAAGAVEGDRLPLGVVVLAQLAVESKTNGRAGGEERIANDPRLLDLPNFHADTELTPA